MRSSVRINQLLKRLEKKNTAPKIIVIQENDPIPEHDENTVVVRITQELVPPQVRRLNG